MANREKYNQCMIPWMKGGGPDRKLRFCVGAKLCSGKAQTEEEAQQLCSLPKEPKPGKDSKKFDSCVKEIEKKVKAGEMPLDTNPYAVCQASVGKKGGSGIFVKVGRKSIEIPQKEYERICPCALEVG